MATSPSKKLGPKFVHDRKKIMEMICPELQKGRSLSEVCRDLFNDKPSASVVLQWVKEDPEGLGTDYTHAREVGYKLLADEIIAISEQTHTFTYVHKKDADGNPAFNETGEPLLEKILVPLSPDVIAHNRLRIDTLKWTLAKMLPKVYGDRVVNEHVGKDDGAIQVNNQVAMDADSFINTLRAMGERADEKSSGGS